MNQLVRALGKDKILSGNLFLVLPALLFLLTIYVYPLAKMILMSLFDPDFTLKHYQEFISTSVYIKVFYNTIKISFFSTLICLVVGYPVSFLLASVSPKTRGLMIIFVIIPFWISLLVRNYAWMVLLGRNGIFNSMLLELGLISAPLKLMYNAFGMYVGMVHILLPYMIFPMFAVMSGIDWDLIRASRSLGANAFQTFIRVYLPLSMKGISAGCLIVFILAIGFFITPALLGGLKEIMISNVIENQVSNLLNWGFGSALAFILLTVAVLMIIGFKKYLFLEELK
ncbi:MAG: ABC transporter permease [Desulfobacterales bacterium]|nr:ABC transporter permease [Desulfobacterales bacterium]